MDEKFLEELGLDCDTASKILNKYAEEKLDSRLLREGVMSVSAAKGVLNELNMSFSDEDAVKVLKEEHPYLFKNDEPLFTGPAGGEKQDTDTELVKKALGLI